MREVKMKNTVEVTKQQKCIHHWIIDSPHGQFSYGKCKRCGTVAEFSNTVTIDILKSIKLPDKTPIQHIN
jgi:hypothetical protein